MVKESVCPAGSCTACEACVNVCPVKTITIVSDACGYTHATVNKEACVKCGLCSRVCPVLTPQPLHHPMSAYAAWASDAKQHAEGASGGVATAISMGVISRGGLSSGAKFTSGFTVEHVLSGDVKDIQEFRNSKYTFSHMSDIYSDVASALSEGAKVLFIGLPCQVAAMRGYKDAKRPGGKLLTIDLVCHGVAPGEYLKQHIAGVDPKATANECLFRDPEFGTENYFFSLKKNNEVIYKNPVGLDLYQIGYHGAHIYRDNCYGCPYARRERVGDLTLGDYSGLGKMTPYEGNRHQVSCVLVNTSRGKALFEDMVEDGTLTAVKRPVEEPLTFERQFNQPSAQTPERDVFLEAYRRWGDYETAAGIAFSDIRRRNRIMSVLHTREIRVVLAKCMPHSLRNFIKRIMGRAD